jgi:hypothetical protein
VKPQISAKRMLQHSNDIITPDVSSAVSSGWQESASKDYGLFTTQFVTYRHIVLIKLEASAML